MLVRQLHIDQGVQLDSNELVVGGLGNLAFFTLKLVSYLDHLVIVIILLSPGAKHAFLQLYGFRCRIHFLFWLRFLKFKLYHKCI